MQVVEFLDMDAEQVNNLPSNVGHVEQQSPSKTSLFNNEQINAFHYLENAADGRFLGRFSGLVGDRFVALDQLRADLGAFQ